MSQRRACYVISTHWDREWYQPFQDYRHRLVALLDHLLTGYADGRLHGPFHLDGQTIVLDDYLEIRPERRAVVEALVRTGKFTVGPWYVMPDEFTVSGESLIRNLRLGHEIARQYGGEPSHAGYICDTFGHNSQMPQIFAGFGIRAAFFFRGTNFTGANFRWRGADGTELPCYRFGREGYGAFTIQTRHGFDPDRAYDATVFLADVEKAIALEASRTEIDTLLLFDGCDHLEWDQESYPALLQRMAQQDADIAIEHTTLDAYVDALVSQSDDITTVLEGELREPALHGGDVDHQWVIPGVLSSRVSLKQANAQCQTLLCQWAEPFTAFAQAALNQPTPPGFLNTAWRWLIQNHPHDSIDGCSIDQVHTDMRYRFDQCRLIAERVTDEAQKRIAASVAGELTDQEMRVTVFNPLPQPVEEMVTLTLEIPAEWPSFNEFFGFEPKPAFRLYTADGEEVPYQRLMQRMNQSKLRVYPTKFPKGSNVHHVTVTVPVALPALGYTTLTARAVTGEPTRCPAVPGMAVSECAMENEHLRVTIEANGTLTMTDKHTGELYSRLLTFEDTADIGDGWYHGVAVNDHTFVSTGARAEIALVHDGPLQTTFSVRTIMAVPQAFENGTRTENRVELRIDSLLTLRPDQPYLDITTTVDNTADDHRVRVLFPSGAEADTYLADSIFDVIERPVALRADNHRYRELEVETKPQQSWTAVSDGRRGLAVVSPGQLESAVRDLPERPIALTLLRGTRRTVSTQGEPGGQERGPRTFRIRLMPLAEQVDTPALTALGQQTAAGCRVVQLLPQDLRWYRTGVTLPATAGFVQVEGPALVSSICQVGDGIEIRLFNPQADAIAARLRLTELAPFTTAQWVNLQSEPLDAPQPIRDGVVAIALEAKKIATVRLTRG